jgi:hypothetical protein
MRAGEKRGREGEDLETEPHVDDDRLGVAESDPHSVSGNTRGADIDIQFKIVVSLLTREEGSRSAKSEVAKTGDRPDNNIA